MATLLQWQLQSVSSTTTDVDRQEGVTPFERRGILYPLQRDQKNDYANDVGLVLIRSHVRVILGTKIGELRHNSKFGSLLHRIRHQNITEVRVEQAWVYTVDALQRWEPRVRVTGVWVIEGKRELSVLTRYDIVDVNAPAGDALVRDEQVEVPLPRAA